MNPCGFAMDELRACYEEDMRFPGVGVVRVRWFFTDKEFLPLPHVYGAWRWWREDESWEDYDDGGPGGITTFPWMFRNGRAPIHPLGCSGYQGLPEAWLGEDNGIRYLVNGFPVEDTDRWDFLTMGG